MEELLKNLMFNYSQYAYIVLFFWCVLEGEIALILAGIMAHDEHLNLTLSILIATFGAFVGDQIYFYIGRYNKSFISSKLSSQRRKFAIANLLLKKYGWPIIFAQRYMYGLRTVIPISIGITKYNAKKFLIINLVSAFFWASITIIPSWYFGEYIWDLIALASKYWFLAIIIIAAFLFTIIYSIKKIENKMLNKRRKTNEF